MCIICNMTTSEDGFYDRIYNASDFLEDFKKSKDAMKAAAASMKQCADVCEIPEAAKRYDRTHKAMVRLMREWNRLEEKRERD